MQDDFSKEDLTGYQWRTVGPAHPHAAEVVPLDDWRVHIYGPSCPCGPAVSLAPGSPTSKHAVTETWYHARTPTPDTIAEEVL